MEGSDGRLKTLKEDPVFLKFAAVLPSTGAIVDDIREITESEVCKYFGPKASKSGWKFAKHTTPEQAAEIYNLWTRVYDDKCIPNKEITLQFARGLILQQTQPVNWAEFAVRRQRYREAVRVSKNLSGKGLESREVAKVGSGGVTVLGKKRFQVQTREDAGIPACLKLTMKEVDEGKRVAQSKVKGGRGKGDDLGPSWQQTEIAEMKSVIDTTETLLKDCRKEFLESSAEVEGLEGQARRAAIMLSDRIEILEEHERELSKISEQEALLQCDEVSLSVTLASKTAAHCSTVVARCRADVASVQGRLEESAQRRKNVQSRVSGLESLLVGMHDQLQRMNEGSSYAFFPRPLPNNPQKPVTFVHTLNACPLCGFWYTENNFVPVCCGHTYHPFCLLQHARSSSSCCFQDCGKEFSPSSIASIGIRFRETRSNINSTVKTEGDSSRDTQRDTLRLQNFGTGSELRGPEISRPALVFHCATPSTSASTAQDSEPSSESFQRREENTIHISARTRSPQPEHVTNLAGTDSCGPRSFSELDKAPQGGFNQSQSRVSTGISGKTHASDGTTGKLCSMCKTKASSLSLTACGHDNFCFKCISGLENCPICTTKIAGWVVTSQKSNPSLFPAAEGVVDHLDASESDDDDNQAGFVEWCSDDLFSQGGVRTVLGSTVANESVRLEGGENSHAKEMPRLENDEVAVAETPERTEDRAPSPKKTFIRRATRTMATEEPAVADVELESSQPIIALSKKRRGRRSLDVDTLNHTRLMERPLTEILVAAPLADLESKGKEKDAQPTSNCTVKRLRTGATRGNSQRLTVPAKFRE